ncbi:MAG: UDP-N-acetylglucosamine pyrophosphorylase [Clostridia bacterium]|nr:UDP-N-acetylglucosamine pyrophosphorylase [Clostridia bacterium]
MKETSIPKIADLYDTSHTIAADLFRPAAYPWELLDLISDYIITLAKTLDPDVYENCGNNVYIARDAKIAPSACINGPCIIDSGAEIRHCAYIRGSAVIGKGAVVGNSCELKNCILFDSVQVPHFNYVGDSILGYKSHMGAGAVTSNVKSDKTHVSVKASGEVLDTGRKKFGAMLGDFVEVGCNSVLCPGTVIGRNTNIYPLSRVRGVIPPDSIYKDSDNIADKY